jgi:UDP-N-acetylglucosamine 2-epimerase
MEEQKYLILGKEILKIDKEGKLIPLSGQTASDIYERNQEAYKLSSEKTRILAEQYKARKSRVVSDFHDRALTINHGEIESILKSGKVNFDNDPDLSFLFENKKKEKIK